MSSSNSAPTPSSNSIPVHVTGLGPISALGCSVDAFWSNLSAGRSGTRAMPPEMLQHLQQGIPETPMRCTVASYLTHDEFDFKNFVRDPSTQKLLQANPARCVQFGVAAGLLAARDAGLEEELMAANSSVDRSRIGIIVGTIGNFDFIEKMVLGHCRSSMSAFLGHAGACTALLSSALNVTGTAETVCGGCPAGLDAAGLAWRLIQLGELDACVVVGTDAELHPVTYASFLNSNSLSTEFNSNPSTASRPFDKSRGGNIVGEGAGALVFESERMVRKRQAAGTYKRTYALFSGYAKASAGSRAYSATSPLTGSECAQSAIRRCLSTCNWQASEVSAVNSNGSASKIYDRIEADAIVATYGESTPVFSIKGATGQHGAGCTALQMIATACALFHSQLPGTINHEEKDAKMANIRVHTATTQMASLKKILCHAISLGGFHWSVLAMEKAPSVEVRSAL